MTRTSIPLLAQVGLTRGECKDNGSLRAGHRRDEPQGQQGGREENKRRGRVGKTTPGKVSSRAGRKNGRETSVCTHPAFYLWHALHCVSAPPIFGVPPYMYVWKNVKGCMRRHVFHSARTLLVALGALPCPRPLEGQGPASPRGRMYNQQNQNRNGEPPVVPVTGMESLLPLGIFKSTPASAASPFSKVEVLASGGYSLLRGSPSGVKGLRSGSCRIKV